MEHGSGSRTCLLGLLVLLCTMMPLMIGCDDSSGSGGGSVFTDEGTGVGDQFPTDPPATFPDDGGSDVPVATTPEPGTLLLLGAGALGLAAVKRLRRTK